VIEVNVHRAAGWRESIVSIGDIKPPSRPAIQLSEPEDSRAMLSHAAWRSEKVESPLPGSGWSHRRYLRGVGHSRTGKDDDQSVDVKV